MPVGINYDRVLEDRFLIAAGQSGQRKFRPPWFSVAGGFFHHLWLRLTGRFKDFGTASVRFGEPLSLTAFMEGTEVAPVEAVGQEIMARVARVVPVPAVPLCARVLLAEPQGVPEAEFVRRIAAVLGELSARGAPLPRREAQALADDAMTQFLRRGVVRRDGDRVVIVPGQEGLVAYYANSIAHHFAPAAGDAATAKQ